MRINQFIIRFARRLRRYLRRRPVKIERDANPERYARISNDILRDSRLSYRARGLLCFLLSQSDGWAERMTQHGSTRLVTRLAAEAKEGREAVQAAIKELAACGYWTSERRQDPDGTWQTSVTVHAVPVGGHPATPTEYRKPVPGEDPKPTGYRKPVLGATSADDQTVTGQTHPPSTGKPGLGFPVRNSNDYREQLKAAASGDLHQSEEATGGDGTGAVSGDGMPGAGTESSPEPSPDVAKVLDGCGVSRTSKAWTRAAADALTRGGTPIEIIGHVMEPVRPNANGEPIRSATAVRLQRLRAWTGPPPPQDSTELYSELLGEFGPRQPPIEALRPALPDHCGECGDLDAPVNFAVKNKNFRYRRDDTGRNRMCTCHPEHPSRNGAPTP